MKETYGVISENIGCIREKVGEGWSMMYMAADRARFYRKIRKKKEKEELADVHNKD